MPLVKEACGGGVPVGGACPWGEGVVLHALGAVGGVPVERGGCWRAPSSWGAMVALDPCAHHKTWGAMLALDPKRPAHALCLCKAGVAGMGGGWGGVSNEGVARGGEARVAQSCRPCARSCSQNGCAHWVCARPSWPPTCWPTMARQATGISTRAPQGGHIDDARGSEIARADAVVHAGAGKLLGEGRSLCFGQTRLCLQTRETAWLSGATRTPGMPQAGGWGLSTSTGQDASHAPLCSSRACLAPTPLHHGPRAQRPCPPSPLQLRPLPSRARSEPRTTPPV
jgi:hypothetical protein